MFSVARSCISQRQNYRRLLIHRPSEKTTDKKRQGPLFCSNISVGDPPTHGHKAQQCMFQDENIKKLFNLFYHTASGALTQHSDLYFNYYFTFALPLLCIHIDFYGSKWRSMLVGFLRVFTPQCTVKKGQFIVTLNILHGETHVTSTELYSR